MEGRKASYLYSCVVFLTADAHATLPATQGHHAHAAFLDLVRGVDPGLAAWLHDARGRKPFTVSPLRGLPEPQRGEIQVPAGWTCWLRFTFLAQPVFESFRSALLRGTLQPRLRLGTGSFLLSEVRYGPGSHPWAGWTTAEALAARMGLPRAPAALGGGQDLPARGHTDCRSAGAQAVTAEGQVGSRGTAADGAAAGEAPVTFSFELASPTAWSLGGDRGRRVEVLPTPALFFGSLLASWNAWFGERLGRIDPGLRDYVAEAIVVSRMNLATRMYRYQDHLQVGTVGRITYRLLDSPRAPEARILDALADLAFFSGVGYRTTMGMGQARRLPEGDGPRAGGGHRAGRRRDAPVGAADVARDRDEPE